MSLLVSLHVCLQTARRKRIVRYFKVGLMVRRMSRTRSVSSLKNFGLVLNKFLENDSTTNHGSPFAHSTRFPFKTHRPCEIIFTIIHKLVGLRGNLNNNNPRPNPITTFYLYMCRCIYLEVPWYPAHRVLLSLPGEQNESELRLKFYKFYL